MSGLPLAAIGAHPLLAQQQQLAARAAAGGPGGQHRNAAAVAAAAAAAAAAADASRRQLAGKKRKALEKPAAEKPLHLVPEALLFNSLAMQAHYVDDLIKRQRLELQAAANPLECPVHKRLRVYIFNTHSHQQQDRAAAAAGGSRSAQQHAGSSASGSLSSSSSSNDPPQWTLVVWGRLENPDPPAVPKASSSSAPAPAAAAATGAGGVAATEAADGAAARGPDAPSAAAAAAAAGGSGGQPAAAAPPLNISALPPQPVSQHSTQQKHPCSGFFKRIQFKFDPHPSQPADCPDAASCITWEKLQHRGPHKDRLEVKRVGSHPTKVTITFEQDFAPPVFKVDERLAEVLCMTFGQQQMVMTRLYSYIVNATPQPDLTNLQLDDKLEPIFGTKQLSAAALPQALGRLLEPLKPITVTHNIVTSGPSPGPATCIDFDVLLPVKLQEKIAPAIDPLLEDKQGEVLDTKIDASLAKLYESRRRRDIYLGFAEDPVGFINTIIASQARELRVSRNNQAVNIERRTDMFREKWVDEAALRYLGRKAKQEALFPSAPGQGLGDS